MTLHTKVRRQTARRAFTLMEMLIVVAIIVILAGAATYYIIPAFEGGKEDAARAKAHEIAKALMTYYKDYDSYPADLTALTQKGEYGGPYLAADGLVDPWGQAYQFDPAGTTYNNGAKPDVWTEHGGKILGNFPKK
jgi:general secretion pathway protein G